MATTRRIVNIERSAICVRCSVTFSYVGSPIGKGRTHCSETCRRVARHENAKARPLCSVEGCTNHQVYSDGICNSCYYRRKRTGTLDKRTWAYRSLSEHGYVVVWGRKDHPLVSTAGMLYEHRMVLYDTIGPGPHSCYWCAKPITWIKGKCIKGALVADHLDGNKQNNDPSNLVAACNPCNAARGLFMRWVRKHQDDPVLWAMYESRAGGYGGLERSTHRTDRKSVV